jgi:uncharacterized protein YndB with AHSA1/START domain
MLAAMSSDDLNHASRWIAASPEAVYRAFTEPGELVEWLPPGEMTGRIHTFDGRIGGGYEMSLYYPSDERAARGKTTAREDRVRVRFVELQPPTRLVEAVTFVSDDPALQGEMTMAIALAPREGGTDVAMEFRDLPPGLRPEDNAEGARLSLAQLAHRLEG